MQKRNYFLIIPLLVVMALVFGVPGGVDAKGFPQCPLLDTHPAGPGFVGHMDFIINDTTETEDLWISGRCRNFRLDPPGAEIIDTDWGALDIGGNGLDEGDLRGLVFQVDASDVPPPFWNLIVACYNLDAQTICVKIVSVRKLVDHGNGEYSADVTLVRVVQK